MAHYPATLAEMFSAPRRHRLLMGQLALRESVGRFQGAYLGLWWPLLHPLLMLAVYTFFFSVVLKAQWRLDSGGTGNFALSMFSGLLLFNMFTEMIGRAPTVIVGNANYVKKVVFPLELLSWAILASLGFHFLIGAALLIAAQAILVGSIGWAALAAPLVLLPYGLFLLGLGWFLSSLGAYVRDIGQVVAIVQAVMLFVSPVFFPVQSLGPELQSWLYLNPLTFPIESFRDCMLHGKWPRPDDLLLYWAFCFGVAWMAFAWFQKTRVGFADVV